MALRTALLAPQSTYFLEKELQRRFNVIQRQMERNAYLLVYQGGGIVLRSGINGAEFVSVIFALLRLLCYQLHAEKRRKWSFKERVINCAGVDILQYTFTEQRCRFSLAEKRKSTEILRPSRTPIGLES